MEEAGAGAGEREESAAALHARLVAFVRAASGDQEGRGVVWMEHSYARAKSGAAVRELLARAPRTEPAHALDVGGPGDCVPLEVDGDAEPADPDPEWEARVLALAPAPAHARAARSALEALRALHLSRLAGAGAGRAQHDARRDQARAAARTVRRALAPHWAEPAGNGVAVWLHGAILAHGGHGAAALWRELAGELRRAVPRLAARLLPTPAAPPADVLARVGPPRDYKAPGPWLVWVCASREDRWARRLRALLHVRVVCGGAPGEEHSVPEAWCAALMGTTRAALLDILAEAGSRPVVMGGAGSGAALCAALLAGSGPGAGAGDGALSPLAGVRGLALIAPPLLTAEGDATHLSRSELELPLLVVAGSAGATCPRGAACELAAGGQLGGAARELASRGHLGGAARRVLVVRGADDALRLPARRRRLPQHALDAYVAEEVARWALAVAEGEREREREPEPEPEPELEPRRAGAARKGAGAGDAAEERHAALHNARGLVREVDPATELIRPRGSGGPRRAARPVTPAAPATPAPEPRVEELDIMQLPIVFADDEEPAPAPAPAPATAPAPALTPIKRHSAAASPSVTVTSGHPRGGRALNYTRVIVAKRRGAARGAPARAPPRAGAAAAPRPVLLRRTVRLVRDER